VTLSTDGKRAVSGSEDATLRVWDLEGNQPPRVLEGQPCWGPLALSADGKRVVSGPPDKTLRVFDLAQGKCIAVFTCDELVMCCAWAGGRIVAGDLGSQLHVFAWEE